MVIAERGLRVSVTILATYLVAVWIATIWWTFRDIRARSGDVWLQVTATLLVAVFNFPGLLIYFILRPQQTLAQSYVESLEEEAWRRSVGDANACPACGQLVEPDFLFCPACQARLRRVCARCERPVLLSWKLCPYCGSMTGSAAPAAPVTPHVP
ncbi:MAG: zinc ribbon domain-containing protein [Chloroflexi bacterium]|nr:zinc ribbon domain-containing protein [Chloroflexota bacterium]